jgi:hypothetical protein
MPGIKPFSLRHTVTHPLARMLPIARAQMQVYRLGEKNPPAGHLYDHAPMWECVTMTLTGRGSSRVLINLQRDFTLMAITTQASVGDHGGFRAQFYDMKKQLRFADRGVLAVNIAGNMTGAGGAGPGAPGAFFLREPWEFDEPDSQLLVIVQNMETIANTIDIAFYGQVLRFNQPAPGFQEFPGGVVSNLGG